MSLCSGASPSLDANERPDGMGLMIWRSTIRGASPRRRSVKIQGDTTPDGSSAPVGSTYHPSRATRAVTALRSPGIGDLLEGTHDERSRKEAPRRGEELG